MSVASIAVVPVVAIGCSSTSTPFGTSGSVDTARPGANPTAPASPNNSGGEAANPSQPSPFAPTNSPSDGASSGSPGASGCVGLQCHQKACPNGGTTSVSGIVYDPAGHNPLYNVVVYVPNSELAPLPSGASCDSCNSLFSGNPIAVAATDAYGKFTLKDVPEGSDIPLVIQAGKWRKKITLAKVAGCQDNPQPDKSLTLPKNHIEGDIPNMAISTGSADALECLPLRLGVDASEYVPGNSKAGRVHIFVGGTMEDPASSGGGWGSSLLDSPNTSPPGPASTKSLWNTKASLMNFDLVLLSCEGDEAKGMNQQAMHDYASAGGRIFASHFHYSWFNTGPYASENLATWTPGTQDVTSTNFGSFDLDSFGSVKGDIITTFPKGAALKTWLENTRALTNGQLKIKQAKHNADVGPTHTASQAWIVAEEQSTAPGATEYFSFNTPTDAAPGADGAPAYCGRVVFSDLHVGVDAVSPFGGGHVVPTRCLSSELSPQEKALEFMLFDLSSCVTPDNRPPVLPPVAPPIVH